MRSVSCCMHAKLSTFVSQHVMISDTNDKINMECEVVNDVKPTVRGHSLIMSRFFQHFLFLPPSLSQSVTPSCPPHNYATPVQPPPKKLGVLITTIRHFTVIM